MADVSGNLGLIPSSGGVTANGGFRGQPGGLNPAGARSGRGIQTHADGKVRIFAGLSYFKTDFMCVLVIENVHGGFDDGF